MAKHIATSSPHRGKIIVGWNEMAALPDWGVGSIAVKIDSGARSSSLHVENIREYRGMVYFQLNHNDTRILSAPIARRCRVRSSDGHDTFRCFVRTRLALGPLVREIEVNLVNRGDMRFPMLIGRSALKGRYLVDCGRRHLAPLSDSKAV